MRLFWCLGMYASASTWLFNLVRQILETQGDVSVKFIADRIDPATFGRHSLQIVKSHEIGDEAAIEWLADQAERMFITIRDPRDAVTSLMMYHGYDFERALTHVDASARLCLRFAQDRRALIWPYETRFFENEESMARIETALGLKIGGTTKAEFFNAMRREQVEAHIAKLPMLAGVLQDQVSGDRLDPRTHWHTHHAGRTGEIGRWRHALTAAQIAAVAARLRGCIDFGD